VRESSKPRDGWSHPASFVLGSNESRAAARNMLEERAAEDEIMWCIVSNVGAGANESLLEPNFHSWDGRSDVWNGNPCRVIHAHDGSCDVCETKRVRRRMKP
jgi:hypothetical protein